MLDFISSTRRFYAVGDWAVLSAASNARKARQTVATARIKGSMSEIPQCQDPHTGIV